MVVLELKNDVDGEYTPTLEQEFDIAVIPVKDGGFDNTVEVLQRRSDKDSLKTSWITVERKDMDDLIKSLKEAQEFAWKE